MLAGLVALSHFENPVARALAKTIHQSGLPKGPFEPALTEVVRWFQKTRIRSKCEGVAPLTSPNGRLKRISPRFLHHTMKWVPISPVPHAMRRHQCHVFPIWF